MSANEDRYSALHLLGNTDVARYVLPQVRSSLRRVDPAGLVTVPSYVGASGQFLSITYTDAALADQSVDIELTSDSLATIIEDINAEDATNLEAFDQDGFLVVRNKNAGKTHRIEVNPYVTPADDAAPILGFIVTPFPGSIGYAGEVASSAGSRSQLNPQGTVLISKDEDLKASTVNRGLAALLMKLDALWSELERDVIVYKDVPLTFAAHPITGGSIVARINDNDLRVLVLDNWQSGSGTQPGPGTYYKVLDIYGAYLSNPSNFDEPLIIRAYYATNATALSDFAFSAWGTPDGGSIWQTGVPNKDKHASVNITSVNGNVIFCDGALFETRLVKKGDPVKITDTVQSPFDCTGWFAVEEVLDEEHISVRPMTAADRTTAAGTKPSHLNPELDGSLRIAVGYFIPAGNVYLEVSPAPADLSVVVRLPCGVPLREALAMDLALSPSARLYNIMRNLMETSASDSGTNRLGAELISIGGSTPHTLAAGTLKSQLITLLTAVRDNVNYLGSGAWADATTVAAGKFEAAIDGIVSALAGTAGAAKIGAAAAGDLTAGTIRSQLNELDTEWGRLDRDNTWTGSNTFFEGPTIFDNAGGDQVVIDSGHVDAIQFLAQDADDEQVPGHVQNDPSGRQRWNVDYAGYPSGLLSVWDEHWKTAGATDPQGWTSSSAATGFVSYGAPHLAGNPLLTRVAILGAEAVAGSFAQLVPEYLAYINENTCLTQQWSCYLDNVDGGDAVRVQAGIQFSTGLKLLFYFDADVSANWRCKWDGINAFDDDSGQTADNQPTLYHMRLDLFGSTIAGLGAGAFRYRFGLFKRTSGLVLTGDLNVSENDDGPVNAPTPQAVRPFFRIDSVAGDSTGRLGVGRVRMCWNHTLVDPFQGA